jgi:hypothetical protein
VSLIGETLGPYRVIEKLGQGGMGEVYAARDTRLDRTVAVKVLPPQLRTSAELRERFEREAKTISSLSHPHICTLFDVGHDRDVDYLVMEHHSLNSGERSTLVADGGYARYLASGHLAFVRGGTLMIAPIDLAGRRLTSTPTPLVENVL